MACLCAAGMEATTKESDPQSLPTRVHARPAHQAIPALLIFGIGITAKYVQQAKDVGQKGKSAINLSNLGKFLPNLAPGYLFMLDLPAASKITSVRPVGGPKDTSNIGGENPNINNLA